MHKKQFQTKLNKKNKKQATKKAFLLFACYNYLRNRAAYQNLEMKGSCPSVLLSSQTLHHRSLKIHCNQSCGDSLLFIWTPKPFLDRSHQDSPPLRLSLFTPLLNIQLFLSLSLLFSPFLFPLQVLWSPAKYFMKSIVFTLSSQHLAQFRWGINDFPRQCHGSPHPLCW